MALFYKDTPGKMDAVNPLVDDDDADPGLKARYAFYKEQQHGGYDGTYPQ